MFLKNCRFFCVDVLKKTLVRIVKKKLKKRFLQARPFNFFLESYDFWDLKSLLVFRIFMKKLKKKYF